MEDIPNSTTESSSSPSPSPSQSPSNTKSRSKSSKSKSVKSIVHCHREDYFPSSALWPLQSVGSRINPCSHSELYTCGIINTQHNTSQHHQHHTKHYVNQIQDRHQTMMEAMGATMMSTDVDSAWLPFTIEVDTKVWNNQEMETSTSTSSSSSSSSPSSSPSSSMDTSTDTSTSTSTSTSLPPVIAHLTRTLGCTTEGLLYKMDIGKRPILFWDDVVGHDGDAIGDWYEPGAVQSLKAASAMLRSLVDPATMFDVRFNSKRFPQHPVMIGGLTIDTEYPQIIGWWATARHVPRRPRDY